MPKPRTFRRSAVVTLTITSSLALTACCDRQTNLQERGQHSAWWRFWHNEQWCGSGYGYSGAHGGYYYGGGSRSGSFSGTARGGFGGSAHGSGGA